MNESDSPFKPYERIGTTGGVPGSVGAKRRIRPSVRFAVLGVCALILGAFWWGGGQESGASDAEHTVQAADSIRSTVLDAPPRKGPGSESTPVSQPQPEAPAPTPVVEAVVPKPPHAGLTAQVEKSIVKWMGVAKEKTKGKVNSSNTVVAVHVRRLNGDVLVNRNTSGFLRPASNLKLLTCMAAVVLCGESMNFETRFDRVGRIEAGVLKGDLVARAGADPMYEKDGDGGVDRWAKSLADQLKEAGISRVEGALVLDEGTYLEPGPAPEWPDERDFWKYYCALSGGFSANAGCLTAHIQAGSVGAPGQVQILPKGHGLERRGSVKTTSKGNIIIAVEAKNSHVTVRGSIPKGSHYDASFSHPDPVELFGYAMLEGLEEEGIQVAGGLKRQRLVPGGETVAILKSPVIDTFLPILQDSNNSVADQLFLFLAHRFTGKGDRASGQAAVMAAMDILMVDSKGVRVVEGSGLSRSNRVRADQIAGVIAGVLKRGGPAAQAYLECLPVAGRSGSLDDRMRSGAATGRVHAKTGFINGSSALSGVVECQSGERLVFSILVEFPHHPGMNTGVFKPMQDEICATLAEFQDPGQ